MKILELCCATLVLTIGASQVNAKILAVCGDLVGYTHYIDHNNFDPNFKEDAFSGRIIFLEQINSAGRISYRTGWKDEDSSPQVDNSPTYLLNHNPTNLTYHFLVDGSNESYTETYLFHLNFAPQPSGPNGIVLLTQTRSGGSPAAKIFHGICRSK